MDPVTQQLPVSGPRDPLAAAVGNASLLGVGYLLLGRWRFAVANLLVTLVLLVLLCTALSTVWFEFVVLAWWAAVTGHGWYLGARPPRGPGSGVTRQRLIAVGVTVVVLAAFGLLRFDAARIGTEAAQARAKGDCAQATTALHRQWLGHRLADAPLAARDDKTGTACGLLGKADGELHTALSGDQDALDAGYRDLSTVSVALPGHDRMLAGTLGRFLGGLPTPDACTTARLADRIRTAKVGTTVPGQAIDALRRAAPAALTECGDSLMAGADLEGARARYQQVLDQYPHSDQTAKAGDGVAKANLAIQLRTVRGLLGDGTDGGQPGYCTNPQPYDGVPPFNGNGPNRVLMYGKDDYRGKLPPGWLAPDVTAATLVVCVGPPVYGASYQTCPYHSISGGNYGTQDVTFHNVSIPVRTYEIKTAHTVFAGNVEVGRGSCPETFHYRSFIDGPPPADEFADPSDDDIRGALAPLIKP